MKRIMFSLFILTICLTAFGTELVLEYKCCNPVSATNQLMPHFRILNPGSTAVALQEVKIRYYFSKEGSAAQACAIDYALVGSSNITTAFFADYLEIGFTPGAGTLAPGANSGVIQTRVHKLDWSNYDQNNDHSHAPQLSDFTAHQNVPLFVAGSLVWGNPPGGTPTPTLIPTPTPWDCAPCDMFVTGVVTDTSGAPVSGAEVSLLSTLMDVTDAAGAFSFTTTAIGNGPGCPIGDTYLFVRKDGAEASRFIPVACGTFDYNITLTTIPQITPEMPTPTPAPTPTPILTPTPACTTCDMVVSGQVVDTAANPVAGAEVYLLSSRMTSTDEDGYYQFTTTAFGSGPGCPIGDTYLFIRKDGGVMSRFIPVSCGTYTYNFTWGY